MCLYTKTADTENQIPRWENYMTAKPRILKPAISEGLLFLQERPHCLDYKETLFCSFFPEELVVAQLVKGKVA